MLEAFVGARCVFEGVASISPHIKANSSAVKVGQETVFLFGQYRSIPADQVGNTIVVSGKLVKKRWPMFIWDYEKQGTSGMPQGMPMPPGTNLDRDSVYYGFLDPSWKLK